MANNVTAATTAAVMNSVNSSTPWAMPQFSALTTVGILIAVVLVCVGAAVVFQYYTWRESPWWSDRFKASDHIWDWMDIFKSVSSVNLFGSVKEIPNPIVTIPIAPVTQSTSERNPVPTAAWCFVGEDLTGRYCVKVPSSDSCDRTRVYASQQDCELQAANSLPAGVVSPHDGQKMTALSSGLLTP